MVALTRADIGEDGTEAETGLRRTSGESLLRTHWDQNSPDLHLHAAKSSVLEEIASPNSDSTDETKGPSSPPARELQHQKNGLWLILAYSIILVLAWTFACVLCYKPLAFTTYYEQTGKYSKSMFESNDWARKVIRTILSILAAVNVPITSTICARAVVVYCSTPPKASDRRLTARQTLVLADKGWSSMKTILAMLRPRTSRSLRSPILLLAIALCGLGVIIPALQGAFVDTVQITVRISDQGADMSGMHLEGIGNEPTPDAISNDLSIQDSLEPVIAATISESATTRQPKLWLQDNTTADDSSLDSDNSPAEFQGFQDIFNDLSRGNTPRRIFTSAFPTGTDTGVCRVLSLSVGSTVTCSNIEPSLFPDPCDGTSPFSTMYSNTEPLFPDESFDDDDPNFIFRACAPSNTGGSPWTANRDRQDISEHLYLDFQIFESMNSTMIEDFPIKNYTYHCEANSTMGYFELPNHWNNHKYSAIFDELPKKGYFHSWWEQQTGFYNNETPTLQPGEEPRPSSSNSTRDKLRRFEGELLEPEPAFYPTASFSPTPGPLLLSALAIFGNSTFYDTVTSVDQNSTDLPLICRLLRAPFISLNQIYGQSQEFQSQCEAGNGTLAMFLLDWLSKFQDPPYIETALTMTTFWSGRTMLDDSLLGSYNNMAALRPITSLPGLQIPKLHISLAAIIAISILIILQLAGLLTLAVYASSRPVWTESLDTFAVLRLGAAMAKDLPLISAAEIEELPALDEMDGWIGEDEDEEGLRRLVIGGLARARQGVRYRMAAEGSSVRLKEKTVKTSRVGKLRRHIGH